MFSTEVIGAVYLYAATVGANAKRIGTGQVNVIPKLHRDDVLKLFATSGVIPCESLIEAATIGSKALDKVASFEGKLPKVHLTATEVGGTVMTDLSAWQPNDGERKILAGREPLLNQKLGKFFENWDSMAKPFVTLQGVDFTMADLYSGTRSPQLKKQRVPVVEPFPPVATISFQTSKDQAQDETEEESDNAQDMPVQPGSAKSSLSADAGYYIHNATGPAFAHFEKLLKEDYSQVPGEVEFFKPAGAVETGIKGIWKLGSRLLVGGIISREEGAYKEIKSADLAPVYLSVFRAGITRFPSGQDTAESMLGRLKSSKLLELVQRSTLGPQALPFAAGLAWLVTTADNAQASTFKEVVVRMAMASLYVAVVPGSAHGLNMSHMGIHHAIKAASQELFEGILKKAEKDLIVDRMQRQKLKEAADIEIESLTSEAQKAFAEIAHLASTDLNIGVSFFSAPMAVKILARWYTLNRDSLTEQDKPRVASIIAAVGCMSYWTDRGLAPFDVIKGLVLAHRLNAEDFQSALELTRGTRVSYIFTAGAHQPSDGIKLKERRTRKRVDPTAKPGESNKVTKVVASSAAKAISAKSDASSSGDTADSAITTGSANV